MIPKISVAIIAFNAEKYLLQVLTSAEKIAEEIVVVIDDKTTDKTEQIAKKFKARIYLKKWLGYAKQKNFALINAKNNWVLSIDSDEVIDEKLLKNIRQADFSKFEGFYLSRKNFFGNKWVKHCGWYPDYQLRLFKKNKMLFEEKDVHEKVKSSGKIGYLEGDILHFTYTSGKDYFEKISEYTALDAKILYNKKRKWSVFYQLFKPLKEFWQMYVIEKGYLDGMLGLKICLYSAYYKYLVAKKLRAYLKTVSRSESEIISSEKC
ncbi:hypothetical protein A3F08_02930 [Candidatus Berkelbacteria bacterium RIFCSPHIGHO2_12_FULL_36_9]|uniref:Glycosyltransferase 2-like domain-containing protein n=1 Tax=Candidatus Berkelbacteria bacterium RIFCSPHIGHO2_12_FULL_36_9 TaxID=1797469 RepID=A0A1F5EEK4_9BACT|nr:MAG: hypothetical protein A3F08_02930 [Candidatus Berkelbacteria bacterium RIFCSPHIGHO2_12_FULL_36_9]